MSEQQKKTIGKGGTIALGACGVVIIVLLVVVIVLLVKNGIQTATSATESAPKRNVVVTPDNVEETISQLEESEHVAPGSYEVTMNTTWNFKDGESASDNAYVANSVNNTNDVYFDITLADTEETIYSSPVIPIGSHLEDITLDKVLEDGTYDCVVTYTLVDEEQNPLSTVRISLTIVIGD
jgi:predicted metalloprotease